MNLNGLQRLHIKPTEIKLTTWGEIYPNFCCLFIRMLTNLVCNGGMETAWNALSKVITLHATCLVLVQNLTF